MLALWNTNSVTDSFFVEERAEENAVFTSPLQFLIRKYLANYMYMRMSRKYPQNSNICSSFLIGPSVDLQETAITNPLYCCNDLFDLHNSSFITSGVNMAAPLTTCAKEEQHS
jgi:hypothetical protein